MTQNEVLRVSAGDVTFQVEPTGQGARLTAPNLEGAARGRFWTMSLVHGEHRDCAVRSEEQQGQARHTSDGVIISYSSLITATGERLDISLDVQVRTADDELLFEAHGLANPDVAVREFALPVLEFAPSENALEEVLYRPDGLGRRISVPRERLYEAHTEYMVDDGAGVWEQVAYPGELSMAWQGLQVAEGFLYIGRHDPEFSSTLMCSGVPPRKEEGGLWLSVNTPLGRSRFSVSPVVVRFTRSSWRAAAARYREWADTWYTGPRSERLRNLSGWQRIIMRHQHGDVYFRYDELVDVYERGRAVGLDGILLFGWWKNGFDRGYPIYEVDEELGGAEELRRAIKEIRLRGGFISLYANGNLVDRESDYFRNHGAEVAKKDSRGLDYVVGYDFAGESRTLRHFCAHAFIIACHGAPQWREQMSTVARGHADLGTDSVFFDQTGYHMIAWPCYDQSHEHAERIGQEAALRGKTLEAIRSAAGGATVGSEGMADCLVPHIDFHHGWGFAFQRENEAFPALFRSTFPEPVVSNRLLHDERFGWQDQLNYAFAHNLIFDVAIHRGRKTVDAYPEYAKRVKKLASLRRQNQEHFSRGTFEYVDDRGTLVHTRYALDQDALNVFWNHGSETAHVIEYGVEVPPHEIVTLLTGSSK